MPPKPIRLLVLRILFSKDTEPPDRNETAALQAVKL
jgi:hypothetical protein